MRYFPLLGFQHVMLGLFPALILVILVYIGLNRTCFRGRNADMREKEIVHSYPDGIEGKNSPFPLILIFIIAGFLLWAFFYIFVIGSTGVNI